MSCLRITVNGEARETEARTVAELCAALGYGEMKIATALNGEFVPKARRAEARLEADDKIEIVAPRQGG